MAEPRTYSDLRAEVLAHLDESGDTGTTRTLVNYALTQAHEQRCAQFPWSFMLWPSMETFDTVASQRDYALHQEFLRPLYFRNRTTRRYLSEIPLRMLQATAADWINDSGTADGFYIQGYSPVLVQPSAASTVNIVSSSASDTTAAKAITVRGMTSSGITTESLTPNGVTTVTGTTSFTRILNVTKAASWVGTCTLKAGSTTLLTLFATELGRSYPQMFLTRLPSSVETLEYRFYRRPSPFSNDNDMPDIPPPFERILVWDALLILATYVPEVNGTAVGLWKRLQEDALLDMHSAFQEGQSIGAVAEYIADTRDPLATGITFVRS